MKLALGIFLHSVRLVFGNIGVALRISALLYLAMYAASFALALLLLPRDGDAANLVPLMLSLLLLMVPVLWIVVAWHRFVLLDETPHRLLATFHGKRMLHYALRSLLVGVLVLGILVIPSVLLALALVLSGMDQLLRGTYSLIGAFVGLILCQRLGLILPAGAIGKPLGVGEAWSATRGKLGTMVLLAVIWMVCSTALNLPNMWFGAWLIGAHPVAVAAYFGWGLVTGWLNLMVGVSILTTLYGVFVEGRPVDGQASAPLQEA